MCCSRRVAEILDRTMSKSESMVRLTTLRYFFHFFSRTVFGFHARDFSLFFTYSCIDFTHGFFVEIFTQGICFHAHLLEKLSRKELAFTHTFSKKFHVRLALFHVQKKTLFLGGRLRVQLPRGPIEYYFHFIGVGNVTDIFKITTFRRLF